MRCGRLDGRRCGSSARQRRSRGNSRTKSADKTKDAERRRTTTTNSSPGTSSGAPGSADRRPGSGHRLDDRPGGRPPRAACQRSRHHPGGREHHGHRVPPIAALDKDEQAAAPASRACSASRRSCRPAIDPANLVSGTTTTRLQGQRHDDAPGSLTAHDDRPRRRGAAQRRPRARGRARNRDQRRPPDRRADRRRAAAQTSAPSNVVLSTADRRSCASATSASGLMKDNLQAGLADSHPEQDFLRSGLSSALGEAGSRQTMLGSSGTSERSLMLDDRGTASELPRRRDSRSALCQS